MAKKPRKGKNKLPESTPLPTEGSSEFSGWGVLPIEDEVEKLASFFAVEFMDIVQTHYASRVKDGEFDGSQQVFDSICDEMRHVNLTDKVLQQLKKRLGVK